VPSVESRLLTTKALGDLDARVHGRPTGGPPDFALHSEMAEAWDRNRYVLSIQYLANVWEIHGWHVGSWNVFMKTSHSLCASGGLVRRGQFLPASPVVQSLNLGNLRQRRGDDSMNRWRFQVRSLLLLVVFLAVGCAALRESSDAWDSCIFWVTLVVLLSSILLAVHRASSSRAFWIGFALFGSAYLALTLVPSVESSLLSTRALGYLNSRMPVSTPAGRAYENISRSFRVPRVIEGQPLINRAARLQPESEETVRNFMRIGHSLLALVAAFLGGQLSLLLDARRSGPRSMAEASQRQ
jgi:hypothetical protein